MRPAIPPCGRRSGCDLGEEHVRALVDLLLLELLAAGQRIAIARVSSSELSTRG
jgi:hypothetical protein